LVTFFASSTVGDVKYMEQWLVCPNGQLHIAHVRTKHVLLI